MLMGDEFAVEKPELNLQWTNRP